MMNEQEKATFEQEIREKVAKEQRAYKAQWREKNREHIREYNRLYRLRKKLCREVSANEEQCN